MVQSAEVLDLIHELRLRRWARLNHVTASARGADWHPIVLDEMKRKDMEMSVQREADQFRVEFVPLEPGRQIRFDAAHATVPRNHFAAAYARQSVREECEELYYT